MFDVLIIGAGPAALSVAAECCRNTLSVHLVAPQPTAQWKQNFGAWTDEIQDTAFLGCIKKQWSSPAVWLDEHKKTLDRSYALLDTPKLQNLLMERSFGSTMSVTDSKVVAVETNETSSQILTESGKTIQGRIVVDASGATTPFIKRKGRSKPGFQVAFGQWIEVKEHPFEPNEMSLMDFRSAPAFSTERPTFLYAMPLSETLLFVEETQLVGRPPMSFDELENRLTQRLQHMGITPLQSRGTELCKFPMGLPTPSPNQPILGFGASASMVHPATGYQLARALNTAPDFATIIARTLDSGTPQETVAAGWEMLWPKEQRQAWQLYRFGMDFLIGLNSSDTREFFNAFFQLKESQWEGYLSGTLPPKKLAESMKSVFRNLKPSLRWRLVRAGASLKGIPLLQAALSK